MLWDTSVVYGQNYSESTRLVGFRQTVRSLVFQMELVGKGLVYVRRHDDASPN